MSVPILKIDVTGIAEATGELQRIRAKLADRTQLHALMATDARDFTKAHVAQDNRHATAQRLGASPTGFRAKASKRIEADSNAEAAIVRIPRDTGLGRAFSSVTIRPGTGRTYLTIPATAETYGRVVRDFPKDAFSFTIVAGRYPALVWREAGGNHRGWTVAFWLRREVKQKQDRTLLPSDEKYAELGARRASLYITSLRSRLPS